jgi:hypothetical protein
MASNCLSYYFARPYLNTKENTVVQLDYIRNKPLLGSVLYSYREPNTDTANQTTTFTYIRDQHQPTWADVPAIPRKATPTKGILRGTVTRQADGAAVYNATVTITSPTRTHKTEPHGKFAFFETAPATYTVTASATDLGTMTTNVTITAGTSLAIALALPPDATPPVFSNVIAGNLTDTAATIIWSTDENSNRAVDYGLTVSYGSTATNAAGGQTTSGDFNFKTLPAGTASDVIIESRDASGNLTPNPSYADSGFSDSILKSTPQVWPAPVRATRRRARHISRSSRRWRWRVAQTMFI